MKRFWWQFGGVISLIVALSSLYLFIPQVFNSLDNRLRDFLFLARGPIADKQIVTIVDIDEKSLKQFGQWPWSRDLFASLIENLTQAQAGIIGLDMVFAEADKTSPHLLAKRYNLQERSLPNYDELLASVFQNSPVVGGYVFSFDKNRSLYDLYIPGTFVEKGSGHGHYLAEATGVIANIPTLQNAFYSVGFFNNMPDDGGVIRRVPLVMRYDFSIYSSLAFEMLRLAHGVEKVTVYNDIDSGVSGVSLGDKIIPTDRFGQLIVNFRGPGKHFTYISAADILNNDFNKSKIAGRYVLIGTSAVGLVDLRATPYDDVMPGVEVHANIIDNVVSGDFVSRSTDLEFVDILMIASVVIISTIIFSLASYWFIVPIFMLLSIGLYYLFDYLLFSNGLILNQLFPLMALILSLIITVVIEYMFESRQKQLIMKVFADKVSPAVMDDLIKHSSQGMLTPRSEVVTVFFSDIRSFTTISEKIGNPVKLIDMLNYYLDPMVENIIFHKGTIDKFIGDAVMAYWNAPLKIENHADHALKSALNQIRLLDEINLHIEKEYGVTIDIGIGLNSGEVTVGEMGAVGRSDYTIIGDQVNLGSRLEGLNKPYGTHILISEYTKELLSEKYYIRPIDLVRVKGKTKAVEIFEVKSTFDITDEMWEDLELYKKALNDFRESRFSQSLTIFKVLSNKYPCKIYKIYVDRAQHYLDNPDEDFDGTTTMLTK